MIYTFVQRMSKYIDIKKYYAHIKIKLNLISYLHVHIEKKIIISQYNSLETIQFLFKVFYNIMKNKRDISNKK